MPAPYRIAAPREPEPPDPADVYEAWLRARARRLRAAVVGAAVATVALGAAAALARPAPPRAPRRLEAETTLAVERARGVLEDARAEAQNEQLRFAEALTAYRLRPALVTAARCPPVPADAGLLVVRANEAELPSPSVGRVLRDVTRGEELLAHGRTMEGVLYANALGPASATPLAARLRADVVVLADVLRAPARTTPTAFEPGAVAGRVLLYDFAERRVVCAGDVDVTSSPQIAYSFQPAAQNGPIALTQGPSLSASLEADLDRRLRAELARAALLRTLP